MKSDIFIEDYTPKSFVLLGNTKVYKESIKKLGGKFNANLKDNRIGWIFPMEKKSQVQKWISSDEQPQIEVEQNMFQKILQNQQKILQNQSTIMKNMKSVQAPCDSEEESEEEEVPIRFLRRS